MHTPNIKMILIIMFFSFISPSDIYALTVKEFNSYVNDDVKGVGEVSFDVNAIKYGKNGYFNLNNDVRSLPDYKDLSNNIGTRNLQKKGVMHDIVYTVVGYTDEVDEDLIEEESMSQNERLCEEMKAKLTSLTVYNEGSPAYGFGKYNMKPNTILPAFINFCYNFYLQSGDSRVGVEEGIVNEEGIVVMPSEMEKLKKFIDDDTSGTKLLEPEFIEVYKTCYNWVCDKGNLEIKEGQSTFETLEDIFITKLYLEPAIKILKSAYKKVFKEDFTPDYIDRTAIISMAIDYFGSQMIPASDDDNSLRITMGRGNFLPVLIDDGMGLSIADRIYHYMIEIANRNNIKELAGWVEEYREVMGIDYEPFTAEEYELFNKGKMVAYREYGKEREKGNPYDYGYVENPEIFESKISFAKAKEDLTNYLKEHFSNSSFMKERNNPEIVARNYMMVRNMCNNEKFLRITDIYCRDTEVITHSRGYESKTIMLADFQRVKLAEVWDKDSDTDTDGDGIADSKEAYEEEEIDISEFIKIYCDYNHLNSEEREEYMSKYSKITVHNYRSNPVLPDTDFDGRDDNRDDTKLDNHYGGLMETPYFEKTKVDFNNDYRYFYMDSDKYYYELSEMSNMMSNMIKEKEGRNLEYDTENSYKALGIESYMWYMGFNHREVGNLNNEYNDVNTCKYALGERDLVYSTGSSKRSRNLIVIAVGNSPDDEKLMANVHGVIGGEVNNDMKHHIGYEIAANRVYEKLKEYDNKFYGDKVYWVVGSEVGGSVANLLAKRL